MTKVTVSLGYTRNMGNFESCRVDIGVEDDVRPNESVTDAYARVKGFVEARLVEEVSALETEIKAVGSDKPVRTKRN